MGKRSMKVLCLELCNYVQLNKVLTPMSTEAACHSCTLYYLPGSTLTHCDNIGLVAVYVYIMKLAMGYIHIPSFIILGSCIYGLHHINGLYYNVWPRANSCHFLLFTKKLICSCTTCHGFQSSCKVSTLYLVWFASQN